MKPKNDLKSGAGRGSQQTVNLRSEALDTLPAPPCDVAGITGLYAIGTINIVINDPSVGEWVREKIPKVPCWVPGFKSLAAAENGEMLGAVVYDAFTPYECCIHVRLDKPGCKTPEVLRAVFAYPFEQLGLKRLTGLVGAQNDKGRQLCTWLGFHLEGCKANGLGDEDELIYGLLRENCRWLVQ